MTKTIEATWLLLQQHQGETFHTAKGLPFTYTIRGGELFVNRRRKSITVSTVRKNYTARGRRGGHHRSQKNRLLRGPATFTRCCWR